METFKSLNDLFQGTAGWIAYRELYSTMFHPDVTKAAFEEIVDDSLDNAVIYLKGNLGTFRQSMVRFRPAFFPNPSYPSIFYFLEHFKEGLFEKEYKDLIKQGVMGFFTSEQNHRRAMAAAEWEKEQLKEKN